MAADCAATILVVDDDHHLRELMTSILRENPYGEGSYNTIEAACGHTAIALAEQHSPDLALLDIDLPGLSGYEVCSRLRRRYGDRVAIMFVSGVRTESFDRAAGFLVGADEYLVKPFAPEELLERVRALLRRPGARQNGREGSPALTGRELEVLRLLADGLSQPDIAASLTISPKTVATHIEHVLVKLDVHSRTQAVAVAYRDGLLRST